MLYPRVRVNVPIGQQVISVRLVFLFFYGVAY
jgi:hypothetical protein